MPTQKVQREEREKERETESECVLGWGGERERERDQALWLLFLHVFSSPGPGLCILGQPEVLLVLPEVLTLVLGPSFVLFLQAFPFLVF